MARTSRFSFASLLFIFAWTSHAYAHPLVDAAQRQFDNADFSGALETLVRAEQATNISHDELVQLLSLRALVFSAVNDTDRVHQELRRLCVVAPDFTFGTQTPRLNDELAIVCRQQTPLTVDTSASRLGAQVRIRTDIVGDPDNLVRSVVVYLRTLTTDGQDTWRTQSGYNVTFDVPANQAASFYVEVVSLGGAVLAARGSREHPMHFDNEPDISPAAVARTELLGSPQSVAQPIDDGDTSPWVWVGVGAGAAVLAATAIVVVLVATAKTETSVGVPQER